MPITIDDFFDTRDSFTSEKSVLQILQEARALLTDPDRWIRGGHAADENRFEVPIESPEACKWSLEGAVSRCANDYGIIPPYFMRLLDAAIFFRFNRSDVSATWFNDGVANHEMILAVLDMAIELEFEGYNPKLEGPLWLQPER